MQVDSPCPSLSSLTTFLAILATEGVITSNTPEQAAPVQLPDGPISIVWDALAPSTDLGVEGWSLPILRVQSASAPRHVKRKVLFSCLAVNKLEEKSNTSYMINKIHEAVKQKVQQCKQEVFG